MTLDSKTLKTFLKRAAQELRGEWLLLGGTLLPAVGINIRSTVDIDLVGLSKKEAAQNLELMKLADKMGLNIESVNQAAAFFLKHVSYTHKDLIPLKTGKSVVIYRPSFLLYLKLKISRLSLTDLADCMAYFHYCVETDGVDRSEINTVLRRAIKEEENKEKLLRLKELRADVAP